MDNVNDYIKEWLCNNYNTNEYLVCLVCTSLSDANELHDYMERTINGSVSLCDAEITNFSYAPFAYVMFLSGEEYTHVKLTTHNKMVTNHLTLESLCEYIRAEYANLRADLSRSLDDKVFIDQGLRNAFGFVLDTFRMHTVSNGLRPLNRV